MKTDGDLEEILVGSFNNIGQQAKGTPTHSKEQQSSSLIISGIISDNFQCPDKNKFGILYNSITISVSRKKIEYNFDANT